MSQQLQRDVPGGHYCPSCGGYVRCDKRRLGNGRQRPLREYGPNHAALHEVLRQRPASWLSVLDVLQVVKALGGRVGHRTYWLDSDVQNGLSDLVGWKFARMERARGSRRWLYQFARANP